MALCLYLFKANLFPDFGLFPLRSILDKRDKRVSKFSLLSFLCAF